MHQQNPDGAPQRNQMFNFRIDANSGKKPNISPETSTFQYNVRPKSPPTSQTNDSSSRVNKKNTTKNSRIQIPLEDIVKLLTLPQSVAAEKLGVSISTLKRRFYELDCGRWPQTQIDFPSGPRLEPEEKGRIPALINRVDMECKDIDHLTEVVLKCAFKQHFI